MILDPPAMVRAIHAVLVDAGGEPPGDDPAGDVAALLFDYRDIEDSHYTAGRRAAAWIRIARRLELDFDPIRVLSVTLDSLRPRPGATCAACSSPTPAESSRLHGEPLCRACANVLFPEEA